MNLKKTLAVVALPVMMSMYAAPSFATGFDICSVDILARFISSCNQPPPVNNPPVSVPEPATLALLGAGLAAAGLARRKKQK